jgi:N-dimethylarginine dimethylaminohydrolase
MHRLMCPPTHFNIEYVINPWMDLSVKVDSAVAHRQWSKFVTILRELGDTLDFIDPDPRCPDMTFSGDAGFVFERTFVPSNFRVPERRLEVEHYIRWFAKRKYQILAIDPGIWFEGLGDIVFHGTLAVSGHGIRSDVRSIDLLKSLIPELRFVAHLRIIDARFFHLAMALAFLDEESVLYYPPAFDCQSIEALTSVIAHAIPVSDQDAIEYFACNNLVVGRTVLLDNCTASLEHQLNELGFYVIRCNVSEFKKSGGSVRCLVLSFIQSTKLELA